MRSPARGEGDKNKKWVEGGMKWSEGGHEAGHIRGKGGPIPPHACICMAA